MKIINIMQCTNLGGMEQSALRLMIGLQEQGHLCEVISLNKVGPLGPLLAQQGIPFTGLSYQGKGGWRSFPKLWRTLRTVKADALIMTGHNLLAMLALGNLCREKRLLAIHFHHTGVKQPWQWRMIYRVALRRFRAITFPSEFVRKEAEALYPQINSVSHLVRNPIVIPKLTTLEDKLEARISLSLPDGVPIIGNAGWLIPRKRFDVFLRVAAKVVKVVPNAIFLIAGDGEDRSRLESLAVQLEIGDRVKWLGWQQNLRTFFQSIDVFLFNSDWDAMGLSPLEAMSYGVPLVASVQQGGLKEIVTNDEYGYLISSHDVDALANMIIFYLQNPQDAKRVALLGRERVRSVSSTDKLTEQVLTLLNAENGKKTYVFTKND